MRLGYRDSIFKHGGNLTTLAGDSVGLKDRALILGSCAAQTLEPVLGYADLERRMQQDACPNPSAQQIFDWVCDIRRASSPTRP